MCVTFRLPELPGDCHTSVATLVRNDIFYFGVRWFAITTVFDIGNARKRLLPGVITF